MIDFNIFNLNKMNNINFMNNNQNVLKKDNNMNEEF